MNKLSKKAKIFLIILTTLIVIAFLTITGILISMCIVYNNRSNWIDMIDQEKIWSTNNKEIVFQMYEPDDYEWHSNNLEAVFSYYGLKYKGTINDKNVLVCFGAIERSDKTISFYDSESKKLLVKADVKNYSGEKFKIKITKDEVDLSEDDYTFTAS